MIAGLALAGGQSRRMGTDKTLLRLGDRPLIAYVLDRLRAESETVAVSANEAPARFASFGVPVLSDGRFIGCGPLAGVLAGLEWAATVGAEALLTIPADTPFAPSGIAASLVPPPSCAMSLGRVHHLVALWPSGISAALRDFLSSAGPHAAGSFGTLIGMRTVPFFAENARDPFWNVNTQADLEAARSDSAVVTPDRDPTI